MKRRKKCKKQQEALCAAQRTLDSINEERSWGKILARITPKVEANIRIRAKSLGGASSRVLY